MESYLQRLPWIRRRMLTSLTRTGRWRGQSRCVTSSFDTVQGMNTFSKASLVTLAPQRRYTGIIVVVHGSVTVRRWCMLFGLCRSIFLQDTIFYFERAFRHVKCFAHTSQLGTVFHCLGSIQLPSSGND